MKFSTILVSFALGIAAVHALAVVEVEERAAVPAAETLADASPNPDALALAQSDAADGDDTSPNEAARVRIPGTCSPGTSPSPPNILIPLHQQSFPLFLFADHIDDLSFVDKDCYACKANYAAPTSWAPTGA